MGNYQFSVPDPPKNGQIVTIVESDYTEKQEFPKSIMGYGAKVKVIGSKNLLCSRPNAPKITATLVQLPNGNQEVFLSNNLR